MLCRILNWESVEMSERNTAIVLAAGQGKRMHSKVQKQFLEIQGYPVLYYSLRCFQESPLIQDIILVTGEESISYCKEEIVQKYGFTKVSAVIPGGKERYDATNARNGGQQIVILADACIFLYVAVNLLVYCFLVFLHVLQQEFLAFNG